MRRFLWSCAACVPLILALALPLSAGWTVTVLNPAGAAGSWAYGISGGQQVGYASVGGAYHASL